MKYFTLQNVLSRNPIIAMIIGHRSAGKTYAFKDWAIRDFKKTGKQFIYIRRNKSELDNIKDTLFNDIVDKYNIDVKVEGKNVYMRDRPQGELSAKEIKQQYPWKLMGYVIPLSLQQNFKSASFPDVNKMCFDEFIIENGRAKYLPNEVNDLLSLQFTVDRGRNDVRLIMLSNSGFIANPYFSEFDIKASDLAKSDWIYRKNKSIICHYFTNDENTLELMNSNIGKVSTESYSAYALENQFADANMDFIIDKKPNGYTYFMTLTDGDHSIDIYKSVASQNNSFWAKNKGTGENTFSTNSKKPIENAPYDPDILNFFRRYTHRLLLTYANPETRILWYDLVRP
jgi:hypothetical protein